ncbi:MAG: hypothetical protein EB094_02965 [Synechococcaceae bacterium WBA_3_309]|nr:hypothetical protein [Synechococcaceae bacterium WBA_3_309]
MAPALTLDLESGFRSLLETAGLSPAASRLLWLPLPMLLVLISAVVGVLVTVWLERKISAAAQQRIGPEYAGALGILQPMADGLKLLFKEDVIPARADGLLFSLGPVLVVVPVILSWLVVPFGQHLLISNVGVGIFLWISLSSIQPIGLLMSGYASNNKYSLLGGLRAAAQSISYEIPLALAVLAVVMMSNSLSTVAIVDQQNTAGILSWNIWRQPVGFLVVFTGALGIVMTVLKAYLLVFIAILLRWTVPRVRIDQLLNFGWKFLLPISLVNLLLTAALKLAFPGIMGGISS